MHVSFWANDHGPLFCAVVIDVFFVHVWVFSQRWLLYIYCIWCLLRLTEQSMLIFPEAVGSGLHFEPLAGRVSVHSAGRREIAWIFGCAGVHKMDRKGPAARLDFELGRSSANVLKYQTTYSGFMLICLTPTQRVHLQPFIFNVSEASAQGLISAQSKARPGCVP